MHEFEFKVRISDQIQIVKMAVGRWATFEILFEYYEFADSALGNNTQGPNYPTRACTLHGGNIIEHMGAHMTYATRDKFEVRTRKTDQKTGAPSDTVSPAPCSHSHRSLGELYRVV